MKIEKFAGASAWARFAERLAERFLRVFFFALFGAVREPSVFRRSYSIAMKAFLYYNEPA